MLTFVTALKYQKDNRRVSLYATLHQPSHCFLRLLFFRPTSTMLWFSQALPLTLKTWRGQSWRQQCYEITHWPPCSLRQSGPIQLHGLQRYPVIAAAAFSCNLCPRNPPAHPPTVSPPATTKLYWGQNHTTLECWIFKNITRGTTYPWIDTITGVTLLQIWSTGGTKEIFQKSKLKKRVVLQCVLTQ